MISPYEAVPSAMMASFKDATAKGMPPDQAMSYVKSLAQQGIAPFVDMPALLKQFQQLKQQTVPPPQQQNIAQQISQLSNMSQQGLGAIRPGAMQPAMPVNPMQAGIGGMDAGVMENPQGFNSGGIVAFVEGGGAQSQSTPTPNVVAANLPKPRSTEDIYNYYANILGQGYVPAFKTQEADLEAIEKEQGIGEFAKSLEEEAELLKTQEKRSLEELMQDKEGLRRQEAADIAGEASGSRSLLEAMSKSRSKAVERERALEKEIRAARAEREKAAIALTKAREAAVEKRTTGAMARVDRAETRRNEAEKTLSDRQFQREQESTRAANELARAAFEADRRMGVARFERQTAMQLAEAEARIKAGQGTSTDYVLGGELAKKIALEAQLRKETDPAKKAALQAEISAVTQSITNISDTIMGTKARKEGEPLDLRGARPAGSGCTEADIIAGVEGCGG